MTTIKDTWHVAKGATLALLLLAQGRRAAASRAWNLYLDTLPSLPQ